MALTRRLSTQLTLEDLSPQLLETVTEAVGADTAMLYVAEPRIASIASQRRSASGRLHRSSRTTSPC